MLEGSAAISGASGPYLHQRSLRDAGNASDPRNPPLSAQSPYAATKVAADQLALAYQASFGTPVTVLRPFNTYGPRQSTRAVLPTI